MCPNSQESHEEIPWAGGESGYECPNCGDNNDNLSEKLVDSIKDKDYKIFDYGECFDWSLGTTIHSWIEALKCRKCGTWYKYENGYP